MKGIHSARLARRSVRDPGERRKNKKTIPGDPSSLEKPRPPPKVGSRPWGSKRLQETLDPRRNRGFLYGGPDCNPSVGRPVHLEEAAEVHVVGGVGGRFRSMQSGTPFKNKLMGNWDPQPGFLRTCFETPAQAVSPAKKPNTCAGRRGGRFKKAGSRPWISKLPQETSALAETGGFLTVARTVSFQKSFHNFPNFQILPIFQRLLPHAQILPHVLNHVFPFDLPQLPYSLCNPKRSGLFG